MKDFKQYLLEKRDTGPDVICLDVPLFIRLLEYAREDAKDDLDLHFVAEKAVELHNSGTEILGMKNYKDLLKK